MKPRPFSRASLVLSATLFAAHSAQADTYNWIGSGGSWDTATANWTGFGTTWPAVSTLNDDAVFGGTAGAVNLTTAISANDLTFNTTGYSIGGSPNILTLDGTTPTVTTNSASVTISAPINLAANATFATAGIGGGLTISGTLGGTGNLALTNNSALASITLGNATNNSVNNVGTITHSGTSYRRTTISGNVNTGLPGTGVIGSNVTGITQSSNTSNLTISGTTTVNSGGTTITSSGLQSLTFFKDNTNYDIFNGTGNLVFNNNSRFSVAHGIDLNGAKGQIAVDNVGTITNSGTGIGGTRIDASIKTNVTGVIQNSATSNLYLLSAISTPGAGAVTQTGNTFTGTTAINAGILYSGYAGALTTTSSITFGGGTLMYGAVSASDLSAKFTATGTTPYSIDTNNQAISYASNLAANGTKGLNKFGPGTLTLSTANTYTGTTTIGGATGTLERLAGGVLIVSGTLNGSTGTDLTFNGTGVFQYSGNMLALTASAGDAILTNPSTFSSLAARGTGATINFPATVLTSTTNAPLDNAGSNNQGMYFGGPSYARYDTTNNVFKSTVYGTDNNAPAPIGSGATLGINDGTKDVQITGAITAQTTASVNTLHVSGAQNVALVSGATFSTNGILKSGGSVSTITGGSGITTTGSGNELVIRTDDGPDTLTISSPILANGASTLTKSGTGTLILSGANTYTGNTAINQGTLILDTPANRSYDGVISGAGALVVTGPGQLLLTEKSTFTGGLTISAGTLKLDFSDAGAPQTEMLNGVNLLTLGSAGALNVVQGGGNLLIKGKASGITTQNLSVSLPGVTSGGIITNAGTSRILVDPNGGTETQVLMGQLQNVILRNGNSERVNTNGSILMVGKSAGAGSGGVTFMYATDGRNGQGFGGNLSGKLVYTPDGGSDLDFMLPGGDNNSSPYNIIPVGTTGHTGYTPLVTNSNDANAYFRMSGSDASVTLNNGSGKGLKIASPDSGRSITINAAQTWTPANGIIMTGSNDFTIQGGFMSSDNNANARSYVFHQQSTGTLTVSSVLNQTAANNAVLKSGPGRMVLSGPNVYTGPTYFNEGTLNAGIAQVGSTSGPFGTSGTLVFAGGTLQYSSVNATDYSPRFSTTAGQPIRIDTNGQAVTYATALNSPGGTLTLNDTAVTKGTLTLTNTNTYTGPTTVTAGTLAIGVAGSLGTGSVTVQSGGTLAGNGTINGSTTIQGTHAPGFSPGLQTFTAGLSYASASSLSWELSSDTVGTRGTDFDAINVTGGTLSIASGVTSSLIFNAAGSTVDWTDTFWDSSQSWLVYDNANSPSLASGSIFDTITISNDSLAQSFAVTGGSFSWSQTGNDVYLNYTMIPEPTAALFGGLGMLTLLRRRRLI